MASVRRGGVSGGCLKSKWVKMGGRVVSGKSKWGCFELIQNPSRSMERKDVEEVWRDCEIEIEARGSHHRCITVHRYPGVLSRANPCIF